MLLPFQIIKTYTTPLTVEQITGFVQDRLEQRTGLFSSSSYSGSVQETSFCLRKRSFNRSPFYPEIEGAIEFVQPTTVSIKITPNYFAICMCLILSIVLISTAFTSRTMTINGVQKIPDLFDRLGIAIFGTGLPMAVCYILCIRPVKQTRDWIIWKLSLGEKS